MKFEDTARAELQSVQEKFPTTIDRSQVQAVFNKYKASHVKPNYLWVKNPIYVTLLQHIRQYIKTNTIFKCREYPNIKPIIDRDDFVRQLLEGIAKTYPFINIKLVKRYIKKIKEITGKNIWELGYRDSTVCVWPKQEYGRSSVNNEQKSHQRKVLWELTQEYYNKIERVIFDYIANHSLGGNHYLSFHGNDLLSDCMYAYYVRNIENIAEDYNGMSTEDFFTIFSCVGRGKIYDDLIILTGTPSYNDVMFKDAHNIKRAVLKYKDLDIYALEGRVFPKKVILRPKTQTVKDILRDSNTERRRIRINRYGWNNFLKDYGTGVVDKCVSPHGTVELLIDVSMQEEGMVRPVSSRILCTTCPSTGQPYFLPVSEHEVNTCKAAQEYLRGYQRIMFGHQQVSYTNSYPIMRV